MERTFHIYNFGCKVNQEEGAAMAALLSASGWREAHSPEDAALLVINTCTVTATADKKDRNLIRRWRRDYPNAVLAVVGCFVQRQAEEALGLGADIVAGVDERASLPALAADFLATGEPRIAVTPSGQARKFTPIAPAGSWQRARAYVKIEDGCDQFCHYCIIPQVRGPVRSLPVDAAVRQAAALLDQGKKELVLTGIHIGAYGQDWGEADALPRLIRDLLALDGGFRLRLGSVEPQQFSPALLDVIATEERLCPHLHIPLQSGSDRILRAMGRRYDTATYAALLERVRALRGDVAFTSDVIVGYPGEREEDFGESAAFCHSCGLAGLHVFPYSRRSGTVAASLPDQVENSVKARRAAFLTAAARVDAVAYARRYIGRELDFLAEEEVELDQGRFWRGHSENYLTLLVPGQEPPGRRARAEKWTPQGLIGVEMEQPE